MQEGCDNILCSLVLLGGYMNKLQNVREEGPTLVLVTPEQNPHDKPCGPDSPDQLCLPDAGLDDD